MSASSLRCSSLPDLSQVIIDDQTGAEEAAVLSEEYSSLWKSQTGWNVPSLDQSRDLIGYGDPRQVPHFSWPGKKRLAISFVLNFEEGSEAAIGDGDTRNETVYEVVDSVQGARDYCVESHFEYGTRVGYWRIMELFDRYGMKMTVSSCGRAVERNPWLVKDAHSRGHEIAAHGYRWQSHARMTLEEEIVAIDKSVKAIENATGKAPVGWHTRSERSPNTRRLLVERGFLYSDDAYNDETPYFVDVSGRLHLILPYMFDTNDMQFQNTNRFDTSSSFSEYVNDSIEWLLRPGESELPRLLTIGLHLRIIGRPGRMLALEQILECIQRNSDSLFVAPREQLALHWIRTTAVRTNILRWIQPSPIIRAQVQSPSLPAIEPFSLDVPDTLSPQSDSKFPGLAVPVEGPPLTILLINPNTSEAATDLIKRHVVANLPPRIKVVAITATLGHRTICSERSFAIAEFAVLDAFQKYMESDGAVTPDGILVACFGDPGVFALRETIAEQHLDIPVIGLAEASMRFALHGPGRFAIVTGGKPWVAILTRLCRALGLAKSLYKIRAVELNGTQLAENRSLGVSILAEACRLMLLESRFARKGERCTCIILGGGLLAGMGGDIPSSALGGVELIDSVSAGTQILYKAIVFKEFRNHLLGD